MSPLRRPLRALRSGPKEFCEKTKKSVDKRHPTCYYNQADARETSRKARKHSFHGGIAQLGERLNGIQEVSGSIPLISTKSI